MVKVPLRYVPKSLSSRDANKQIKLLKKSRKLYKSGKYVDRSKTPLKSYKAKKSKHLNKVFALYGYNANAKSHSQSLKINTELAKRTKCKLKTLKKIVNKGAGAYYSSGSRPNQTAQSWGIARLASSLTGGKAAAVDYKLLESGCKKDSMALKMAKKSRKKYGYGTGSTKTVNI